MNAHLTIALILDRVDTHWCDSALKIKEALQRELPTVGNSVELSLVYSEESLTLNGRELLCIICHPTERILAGLKGIDRDTLWIFVSGGDRPAEHFLHLEIKTSETIWFSGIYGREAQFAPWFAHWRTRGFERSAFQETTQALFSGRSGLGITANRLQSNLLPLLMLLDGYKGMCGDGSKDANASDWEALELARKWLSDALSQLWINGELVRQLSKDAALIYGAIKNWRPDSFPFQTRLVELLYDFLPKSGAHVVFDPALDEAMRGLMLGHIELTKVEAAVSEWSDKLLELSKLLENMPNDELRQNS